MEYMEPFDFFKYEAENDDITIRAHAMEKVTLVAALVGPEKTRESLIPYLENKVTTEEFNQVLLPLSHKLGKMLPLVGGPDNALSLIPIIEHLCDVEESVVRTATVESACKLIQQIGPNHKSQVNAYFDLVKRISNDESGEMTYSRVSSCYLVSDLYYILNENDSISLRSIYTRLCKDEFVFVRRAACEVFMKIAANVDAATISGDFMELLKVLCADESPVIQAIAVEAIPEYAKLLKRHNFNEIIASDILAIIRTYVEHESWKLRKAIAKNFGFFSQCFTRTEIEESVFEKLVHLVRDPEPEVRTVAITQIIAFLDVMDTDIYLKELLRTLSFIIDDPIVNMRKLLGELCIDTLTKIGLGDENDDSSSPLSPSHLVAIVLKLLNDEDAMVQIKVVSRIPLIAKKMPSLCHKMTAQVSSLLNLNVWRLKKEIILIMPALYLNLGKQYITSNFMEKFLSLATDGVDEVREAFGVTVSEICAIGAAEEEFVQQNILPTLKEMLTSTYLVRLSLVGVLNLLAKLPNLSTEFIDTILTMLREAAKDKVVNVRLRVAQVRPII